MENANLANGQKKNFIFMPHQIILPHKIKFKKKTIKKTVYDKIGSQKSKSQTLWTALVRTRVKVGYCYFE